MSECMNGFVENFYLLIDVLSLFLPLIHEEN